MACCQDDRVECAALPIADTTCLRTARSPSPPDHDANPASDRRNSDPKADPMTSDENAVPTAKASIWIDAPPEAVWRNVANIQSLARHSPETFKTDWLSGSERHEVGAGFRGHNSNGRHNWSTDCVISEFAELHAFAFDVAPDSDGRFSTRWRYTFAAEGRGTMLTESFESPVLEDKPSEMNPDRRRVLIEMLNTTLQRIKDDIEPSANSQS